MKFLENIENGTTDIKKMGIIKALVVMIISILLEGLGQVPEEFLNLFSGRLERAVPFVIFIAGVMVKYYVIIVLLKWLGNKAHNPKPKQPLNIMSFIYVALMIIAFRIMFDNSLSLWISKMSMPDFINEGFQEQSVSPIILILNILVVAPIYEEIIFRGILLKGMANKINPIIALVISALFFAIVHFNVPQGINAFLLGLIIGSIYLKSNSIYLGIFTHFVNNLMAITISSVFVEIEGKYAMEMHGVFFVFGVILFIISYNGYKQNKIINVPDIYKEFIEI